MPSSQVSFYCGRFFSNEQESRLKHLTKVLSSTNGTNQAQVLLSICELDPDFLGQLFELREAEQPGVLKDTLSKIFQGFPRLRQALGEAVEETQETLTLRRAEPADLPLFTPESEDQIKERLRQKGLLPPGA